LIVSCRSRVNKIASFRRGGAGGTKISLECFCHVVSIKLDMDDQNPPGFVGPHVKIGGDTIVVVEPCAHMLEGVG
jgi:hypothetical protein